MTHTTHDVRSVKLTSQPLTLSDLKRQNDNSKVV